MFEDNAGTITNSKAKRIGKSLRHMLSKHLYVIDMAQSGNLVVEKIPTQEQMADLLTKPLPGPLFSYLRDGLMSAP